MRCQALDQWGLRCKAKAVAKPQTIHADSELTSYDSLMPPWVVVRLCKKHKTHDYDGERFYRAAKAQRDKLYAEAVAAAENKRKKREAKNA